MSQSMSQHAVGRPERRRSRGAPRRVGPGLAGLVGTVLAPVLAAGCQPSAPDAGTGDDASPRSGRVAAPGAGAIAPTPPELATAATRLTLEGRTYELRAELWRDFMPIAPPDGRPLVAIVELVPATGGGASGDSAPGDAADVRIERVWVIRGERAWTTDELERRGRTAGGGIEVVARDGPKWGPGATVDVAVRLRLAGGDTRLLRSDGHRIERTD